MTIAISIAVSVALTVGAVSLVFYERDLADVLHSLRVGLAKQGRRFRLTVVRPRRMGGRT